jgi:hypothetical protein|tara:strand:+ start:1080 stop:1745 length:666 start_codon:yes stop_codon:yes gene_type:complete
MASSGTFLNLTLPDVGTTLGPTWATTLNDAFVDLDDHDHSTQGKSIPSAGLNINADVEFNGYSATELKYGVFEDQGSDSTTARSLYSKGNDLHWRNSTASIQITKDGLVKGDSNTFSYYTTGTSSTYTIPSASGISFINAAGTGTTTVGLTLPSAGTVAAGRFYYIKDGGGAAGTRAITITAAGTNTIDGGTAGGNFTISTNYGHAILVCDGSSKWFRMQN